MNKRSLIKVCVSHVLVLVISLLLFQCQSFSKVNSGNTSEQQYFESWNQRNLALKKYKQWQADGKIGFTFPYQGKRKAVTANIDWQQNDQNFDMVFSGPLGMGHFSIEKRAAKTILTNHQGEQYIASSPENLFNEHTGMQIPWSDLSWWVRALPTPKKPSEKNFMQDGIHLEKLEQSGWTIDYLSYKNYQKFLLPQKIKFSNGEINSTLIIRDWKLIQ